MNFPIKSYLPVRGLLLLKTGKGLPSLPALHSAGGVGQEGTKCAAPRNNS